MNREAWLHEFAARLAPMFDAAGFPLKLEKVRLSVGFPKGGKGVRKSIGQCWSNKASADGFTQIFVSPILGTAREVDHVLTHELVHHVVGLECGHKGDFATLARALGLAGKLTATTAGDELRIKLDAITAAIGPYPHGALNPSEGVKKQATRMLKLTCDGCGYICRTTQRWLDTGLPTCHCGGEFQAV